MLILGIYTGGHDANAALFDNYRMLAAVQQERMTRRKGAGRRIPHQAIDECLKIAGITGADVDAVTIGRSEFRAHLITALPMRERLRSFLPPFLSGPERRRFLETEMRRLGRTDSENMFDASAFLRSIGCRRNIPLRFFNHHEAHALPCLFHTEWGDSDDPVLLYTADGGGDSAYFSHRVFRDGEIDTLYGGDEVFLEPLRIHSVGLAYAYATEALGYRRNRHEGKLTGLAAWGDPVLKDAIGQLFRIDDAGQISS